MKFPLLAACFLGLAAVPATAATINVSGFSKAGYEAQTSAFVVASENFEGFGEGNVANGFSTAVGSFATLGGTGSGGTVTNADFTNNGSQLAVRDGNVYGRRSTTQYLTGDAADKMFFDSNDTKGIKWTASIGGGLFNKIVLTISDAADQGAIMEIIAGGTSYAFEKAANGNKKLVVIKLDEKVAATDIFFRNLDKNGGLRINDGFSLDDIAVSEVPLPASALLLLGGLGGLTLAGRRKKA